MEKRDCDIAGAEALKGIALAAWGHVNLHGRFELTTRPPPVDMAALVQQLAQHMDGVLARLAAERARTVWYAPPVVRRVRSTTLIWTPRKPKDEHRRGRREQQHNALDLGWLVPAAQGGVGAERCVGRGGVGQWRDCQNTG